MKSRGSLIAIVAFGCTVCLYAFAVNRKVTIPADSSGIKLFNGWTAAVTFNATCYDTGGSVAFTTNAVSLGAKEGMNLVTTGVANGCPGGTTFDTSGFINGMGGCNYYSTDYASGITQCPTAHHVCSIVEYTANRNGVTTDAFLSDVGMSSWSYSTNGDPAVNNTSGHVKASYSVTDICYTAAAGAGTQYTYCTSTEFSPYDANPICCPDASASAVSCTVEITSAGGHLQSPQFKGNSPF